MGFSSGKWTHSLVTGNSTVGSAAQQNSTNLGQGPSGPSPPAQGRGFEEPPSTSPC